jgi:TRAP-type mannitol/chloroaromatic compound transport system permease small subunit
LKDEQMMVFNQAISYLLSLFERWNFDLIYLAWLWSLFKPLCILLLSLFLLPAVILIFMYGSSFFCLIYKHWNRLKVGKILFFIDRKIKAI